MKCIVERLELNLNVQCVTFATLKVTVVVACGLDLQQIMTISGRPLHVVVSLRHAMSRLVGRSIGSLAELRLHDGGELCGVLAS